MNNKEHSKESRFDMQEYTGCTEILDGILVTACGLWSSTVLRL